MIHFLITALSALFLGVCSLVKVEKKGEKSNEHFGVKNFRDESEKQL